MSFDESDTLVNTSLNDWTDFTQDSNLVKSTEIMLTRRPEAEDCLDSKAKGGAQFCRGTFRRQNARRSLFSGSKKLPPAKLRSAPMASSTMIDYSGETMLSDDISTNVKTPRAQSTMIHDFIPCASSTMVQDKLDFSKWSISTRGKTNLTEAETWSIDENRDTVLHRNYLRRYQNDDNRCLSVDFLSTIAPSTFRQDVVGIETDALQTIAQTKENDIFPVCTEKVAHAKEKHSAKLPKLVQAIKDVKQGLKKKTKSDIAHSDALQHPKEFCVRPTSKKCAISGFQVHDKQAVARKLHRFRESFRRKDLRRLHTLATL